MLLVVELELEQISVLLVVHWVAVQQGVVVAVVVVVVALQHHREDPEEAACGHPEEAFLPYPSAAYLAGVVGEVPSFVDQSEAFGRFPEAESCSCRVEVPFQVEGELVVDVDLTVAAGDDWC